MGHAMQPTSLLAYFSEVLPDLGDRQMEVLRVFIQNTAMDFTNTELSDELDRPINTITPRVYELRGLGKKNPLKDNPLLVESQTRECKITRRQAKAWAINPDWRSGGFKVD